jgi:hypothetical protein
MAPDTGHIVTSLGQMKAGDSYEILPAELQGEARDALGGASEGYAPPKGKLSRWAAARKKARGKMAKASRRRNR